MNALLEPSAKKTSVRDQFSAHPAQRAACVFCLSILAWLRPAYAQDDSQKEELKRPMQIVAALTEGKDKLPSLVGRSGALYVHTKTGDGHQWKRQHAGGVSTNVQAVYRTGEQLYAVGHLAPLFRREGALWSVYPLGNRGDTRASRGPDAIISIGRHLYQLNEEGAWKHIGSTRRSIRSVYAQSPKLIYAATEDGSLWKGSRRAWKQESLTLPANDQIKWIIGSGKLVLLISEQHGVWARQPKGWKQLQEIPLEIQAAGSAHGKVFLAGTTPKSNAGESGTESMLFEIDSSLKVSKKELWQLEEGDHFSLIQEASEQRLVVVSHHGTLQIRDAGGQWLAGQVSLAPPPPPQDFKGRGPAKAR
jgi:hypothetical protein